MLTAPFFKIWLYESIYNLFSKVPFFADARQINTNCIQFPLNVIQSTCDQFNCKDKI